MYNIKKFNEYFSINEGVKTKINRWDVETFGIKTQDELDSLIDYKIFDINQWFDGITTIINKLNVRYVNGNDLDRDRPNGEYLNMWKEANEYRCSVDIEESSKMNSIVIGIPKTRENIRFMKPYIKQFNIYEHDDRYTISLYIEKAALEFKTPITGLGLTRNQKNTVWTQTHGRYEQARFGGYGYGGLPTILYKNVDDCKIAIEKFKEWFKTFEKKEWDLELTDEDRIRTIKSIV